MKTLVFSANVTAFEQQQAMEAFHTELTQLVDGFWKNWRSIEDRDYRIDVESAFMASRLDITNLCLLLWDFPLWVIKEEFNQIEKSLEAMKKAYHRDNDLEHACLLAHFLDKSLRPFVTAYYNLVDYYTK